MPYKQSEYFFRRAYHELALAFGLGVASGTSASIYVLKRKPNWLHKRHEEDHATKKQPSLQHAIRSALTVPFKRFTQDFSDEPLPVEAALEEIEIASRESAEMAEAQECPAIDYDALGDQTLDLAPGFHHGLRLATTYPFNPLFQVLGFQQAHDMITKLLTLSRKDRYRLGLVADRFIPAKSMVFDPFSGTELLPAQRKDTFVTQMDDHLVTQTMGLLLDSPVGLAAGFDTTGKCVAGALDLGFSFTEIGTITLRPQMGDPQPKTTRDAKTGLISKHYDFPNDGAHQVAKRLKEVEDSTDRFHCQSFLRMRKNLSPEGATRTDIDFAKFRNVLQKAKAVAVNVGINHNTQSPLTDLKNLIHNVGPHADMLVLNVLDAPCTRINKMKHTSKTLAPSLEEVVMTAVRARDGLKSEPGYEPALLLKLRCDENPENRKAIAALAMRYNLGLVIGDLPVHHQFSPIQRLSTDTIRDMRQRTEGKIPIVGVGGIETAADAYEKIKAGANLVEIYASLIHKGPMVVTDIKSGLVELVKQDGFDSVQDAVGADSSYPATPPPILDQD